MNPFSYVFQAVAGFSIGFLILRPDKIILPSNGKKINKWPHDVPMIEETASGMDCNHEQKRVLDKQEMKVAFTSCEMKKSGGGEARGHQWGISPRRQGLV